LNLFTTIGSRSLYFLILLVRVSSCLAVSRLGLYSAGLRVDGSTIFTLNFSFCMFLYRGILVNKKVREKPKIPLLIKVSRTFLGLLPGNNNPFLFSNYRMNKSHKRFYHVAVNKHLNGLDLRQTICFTITSF
jgi:hypothetical protein